MFWKSPTYTRVAIQNKPSSVNWEAFQRAAESDLTVNSKKYATQIQRSVRMGVQIQPNRARQYLYVDDEEAHTEETQRGIDGAVRLPPRVTSKVVDFLWSLCVVCVFRQQTI